MITLFRRIRERLIASGSLTKYLLYAIGEILLVVIGILIALQVNNWNEQRKDRNYEITMLKEVSVALDQNISDMESSLDYLNRLKHSAFELATIKNDPSYPRDSLLYHLEQTRRGGIAVSFNSSAYEAIKSSGMDKISDPDLRKNLSMLYEKRLRSVEGWINEIIREDLLKKSDLVRQVFHIEASPDSLEGISTYLMEPDYEWVRSSRDFESYLMLSGGYISRAMSNIEYAIESMTEVRDQIQTVLSP